MRAQLVREDAYGKLQVEKWEKEKARFISQQIEPGLSRNELRALQRDDAQSKDQIEARVEVATPRKPSFWMLLR